MNKHFDKLNASKKGFTIIELIVVIAIIAVLAGIVLVNVQAYINKSKGTAFRASVDQFIKAALVKKATEGSLPEVVIGRFLNSSNIDGWINKPSFENEFKTYISNFPKPPFTGYFWYIKSDEYPCQGSAFYLLLDIKEQSYFSDWSTLDTSRCYPLQ